MGSVLRSLCCIHMAITRERLCSRLTPAVRQGNPDLNVPSVASAGFIFVAATKILWRRNCLRKRVWKPPGSTREEEIFVPLLARNDISLNESGIGIVLQLGETSVGAALLRSDAFKNSSI